MSKEEIKMFILELKDMCDKQMNRDGVHPSHRAGVYDQFDTKLKQLERSDNSDYAVTPTASPKLPSYDSLIRHLNKKYDDEPIANWNYKTMYDEIENYLKLGNFAQSEKTPRGE